MPTRQKIVFIVPPTSLSEIFKGMGDVGNKQPFMGILLLAGLTRKLGYETHIIDSYALNLKTQDILIKLGKIKPDYVGITSTTLTISKAGLLAKLIKERMPRCKIIVGGKHITALPELTMEKYPEIDIGIVGEGEETLTELLEIYKVGKDDFGKVNGIVYRDKEAKVIRTGLRHLIQSLDSYPPPAWDLISDVIKYYRPAPNNINKTPAISMIVSRGCPLGCTFCFNRSDERNRHVRWYSIDKIISLIDEMVNVYGIKEIAFMDDNMIANRRMMKEFCNRLIHSKYKFSWSCYGSTNFADEAIFRLMKKAGCWQISWGIEHACQEILDVYGKGIKISQMIKGLKLSAKCGISNRAFLMHGNFLETLKTIKINIEYLLSLPLDEFQVGYFIPFPGTQAYYEVEKYGKWLINPNEWEKYGFYDRPIFLPNGLTEQELVDSHTLMLRRFYFRPRIYAYFVLKMIKNPSIISLLTKTAYRFVKNYKIRNA